jgi:hypothetical protein
MRTDAAVQGMENTAEITFTLGKVILNTVLLLDDQMTFARTENDLQIYSQLLNTVTANYDLEISYQKSVVFLGKQQIISKIMTNGKIVEHVQNGNYLGCMCLVNKTETYAKGIHTFQSVCGTVKRAVEPAGRWAVCEWRCNPVFRRLSLI